MRIIQDNNASEFLEGAGPLLHTREAEYGLMLGLAERVQKGSTQGFAPVFVRLIDPNDVTIAAFIQTREENGIVTHASQSQVQLLAEHLISRKAVMKGVVGPTSAARAFADFFAKACNGKAKLAMAQKILRLRTVIPPRPCQGHPVQATSDNLDLVTSWIAAFENEAIPHNQSTHEAQRKLAEQKIIAGEFHLWEFEGEKVAMAATARPTKSGISVNAVYTPKTLRGRGYASNLVATISQKMLDSGRSFCVLYTDASNPTSNKIYQSLGYEIIDESSHYLF